MHNIVVIIYDLSPYRGSEAAVGWNYVIRMRRHCNLTVIYGRGRKDMERYLSEHSMPDVRFINIEPKDALKYKRGFLQDYYDTIYYTQWHKTIYHKVLQLIDSGEVDLIHHLSLIGFKEPGQLWRIKDVPFVWGPIMCVENRPFALYPVYSFKNKIGALTRRIVHNTWFVIGPRVNRAFKSADKIFAVTPNGLRMIEKFHHRNATYMPENGIVEMLRNTPIKYSGNERLQLIWVGRVFDESKGLELVLEALSKLQNRNWHLHAVGEGPLPAKLAHKYSDIAENITLHGQISRSEVLKLFQTSHLHIISSLGEATTTVIWEAMSNGIPTMTLDHCGMAGVVCNHCGIKIPIKSYRQVTDLMSHEINNLLEHPHRIEELSTGVLECSKKFLWENRIDTFVNTYNQLISDYGKNTKVSN